MTNEKFKLEVKNALTPLSFHFDEMIIVCKRGNSAFLLELRDETEKQSAIMDCIFEVNKEALTALCNSQPKQI